MTPDEDGRYKLDAGLGLIDVSVHWDNRTDHGGSFKFHEITINADHADIDKDHNCENGCGKTVGTHEDADLNHICDYGCKETIGICADADYDHKCDYGCGKNFGTHVDADLNHICDYGCKEAIGICVDADKDHKCDYGCGKNFGTHEDADLNHICDYGCDEAIGICADADKDHKCDYGCGKTFGVCSGGTATCKDKAVCDYCGKPYGELDSSNHAGGTEVRNAKDATCTEDGYTGDTYCKGCETKLQDGKLIPATGHDFGEDGKCECGSVKFTVTFDPNGGTVDPTGATTNAEGKLGALPTPTRTDGYRFDGWFTAKTGGTQVTVNTVFTAHTTLYARWAQRVERLDFGLSGHGYKEIIVNADVTPGAENLGATYGDSYEEYGLHYGITNSLTDLEPLSSGVFEAEKAYYVYIRFYEAQGYALDGLKAGDVFLNGVAAESLEESETAQGRIARFKLPVIFTVKIVCGKNGSITYGDTAYKGSKTVIVPVFEGEDATFTITPNAGYARSKLWIDEEQQKKTVKTYTFEDVQESHTLRATFAKASDNPKTGDQSYIDLALDGMFIAAGALAALLILRKKKGRR